MADYRITRNFETGQFSVSSGAQQLGSASTLDTSQSQAEIDALNDQYEAGEITGEEYSLALREASNERTEIFENSSFADSGKHFYGERLNINLGNEGNTLIIDQNALDALAAIETEELTSPQHVLYVDGTERLVIEADVVQGFDPDSFRNENEVVGIDGGNVVITNTQTYEMREADEWMNGEVFQFGDENGTKFVLNNVMGNDVGVETLVIGGTEIDLGDRLRRFNELGTVRIEVTEAEALANGSYTEYGDGRFGIRDMDAIEEQTAILVGIQEDIRQAVIDTQNAPSMERNLGPAPSLNIAPN